MPEEKKQFVGPKSIDVVVDSEIKTNGGNDVVEVRYTNGEKELMPKVSFEAVVTDGPTDFNHIAKAKYQALLEDLIKVSLEHDIKGGDIENLKISFGNELSNIFNRADNFLWTTDDSTFTPGVAPQMERSLLEGDIVIRGIAKQYEESQ